MLVQAEAKGFIRSAPGKARTDELGVYRLDRRHGCPLRMFCWRLFVIAGCYPHARHGAPTVVDCRPAWRPLCGSGLFGAAAQVFSDLFACGLGRWLGSSFRASAFGLLAAAVIRSAPYLPVAYLPVGSLSIGAVLAASAFLRLPANGVRWFIAEVPASR